MVDGYVSLLSVCLSVFTHSQAAGWLATPEYSQVHLPVPAAAVVVVVVGSLARQQQQQQQPIIRLIQNMMNCLEQWAELCAMCNYIGVRRGYIISEVIMQTPNVELEKIPE